MQQHTVALKTPWNGYVPGQTLKTPAEMVAYFRALSGGETKLNDDQITAIINQAWMDAADDASDQDLEDAILEGIASETVPDAAAKSIAITSAPARAAREMAEKVKDNGTIAVILDKAIETEENRVTLPRDLCIALVAAYGKEGMNSLPLVGSTIDGDKGTRQSNNPDVTYISVTTESGGTRKTRISYIEQFAKEQPRAVKLQAEVDAIADKYATKDAAYQREVPKLNARIRAIVKVVRTAIRLYQQMEAVNSYPMASVEWVTEKQKDEKTGKMVDGMPSTTQPLVILNPSDKLGFRYVTSSQFLSLDTDAAREKGGTFDDLMNTMARGPRGIGEAPFKMTKKNWYGAVLEMLSGLETLESDVTAFLDKSGPESDEALEAFSELEKVITDITSKKKYASRLSAIMDKRANERKRVA